MRLAVAALLLVGAGCGDDEQPASPPEPTAPTEAESEQEAAPEIDDEMLEALEALGYVDTAPTDNPDQRGVTSASDGSDDALNLYTSRIRANAKLVDMQGEVVHTWSESAERPQAWMHVEPFPNGDLLAIVKDDSLVKHDWDGDLVWRTELEAHHDLAIREDGKLLVLVREPQQLRLGRETLNVLADGVAILSPNGEVERTVELLPLFRDVISSRRLNSLKTALEEGTAESRLLRPGGVGDVMHTNAIEILTRDIEGVAPAGSLLLSCRALSRIAIVNAELTERLWIWGRGELDGQHDPTVLPDGNILIFDNGLRRDRNSRVVEMDPRTGEVVWTYAPEDLFSSMRGGAQRLSSGNVLVTESDSGHALEVTRAGETVWEFWNPDVVGEGDEAERGVIYRLNRFPRSFFEPLSSD